MRNTKFSLKKVRGFFIWNYLHFGDCCVICRENFREFPFRCYTEESVFHGCFLNVSDNFFSKVGQGMCGHIFHIICIEKWLVQNQRCPLCSKFWFYEKLIDIVV